MGALQPLLKAGGGLPITNQPGKDAPRRSFGGWDRQYVAVVV